MIHDPQLGSTSERTAIHLGLWLKRKTPSLLPQATNTSTVWNLTATTIIFHKVTLHTMHTLHWCVPKNVTIGALVSPSTSLYLSHSHTPFFPCSVYVCRCLYVCVCAWCVCVCMRMYSVYLYVCVCASLTTCAYASHMTLVSHPYKGPQISSH
ncbi:hypothetical protein BU24DRAFT_62655 [Aaosphaeria arxii CBS 175.79]|uniref:Uncharacterized protein n=1 Tax=Aaosphaeria arxii CBS 175.79 TaxID=1450172 RepID=A0A6A5XCE5_9PLEO|nr:uncharacterized protein BU24DRAFT_62655 [Aaosphaeria arxii CBS 175.79]KAF2010662.1 hypothetical protein BU24DRAFT_62655 [Aaosphaeria arxii CBS 175.79]